MSQHWNGDCAEKNCTREAIDESGLCRKHKKGKR